MDNTTVHIEPVVQNPPNRAYNQVHISEELRQFILKITTKCETCGFPIYMKKYPHGHPVNIDELINTSNNLTNNDSMLRTDITQLLINYIHAQCKIKLYKIYPNEDIKELFKLTDTDELTISNLQEYIKPHTY